MVWPDTARVLTSESFLIVLQATKAFADEGYESNCSIEKWKLLEDSEIMFAPVNFTMCLAMHVLAFCGRPMSSESNWRCQASHE